LQYYAERDRGIITDRVTECMSIRSTIFTSSTVNDNGS